MNPEISELFNLISSCRDEIKKYPWDFIYIGFLKQEIDKNKEEIQKISATLNPQIPEPYASMSRDEILGGIGQYEKNKAANHA